MVLVLSSDALTVDLPLPNEEKLTALKLICEQDKNLKTQVSWLAQ